MANAQNSKSNGAPPGTTPAAPVKKPYNAEAAKRKAYNAYHSAKQRCTNPKNPGYANWAGKGIKFLLPPFAEFIAELGLPKQHQSLDRINPSGHYELANVRWTTSKGQNSNKVGQKGGATPTLDELIEKATSSVAQPALRRTSTEAYNRFLGALRRGHFTPEDVAFFQAHPPNPTVFDAGFELGQFRDYAEPLSFYHLPSITWPGRAVRMMGGPFEIGTTLPCVGGMHLLPIEELIPKPLASWIKHHADGGGTWVGQVSEKLLRAGGVEGWMMHLAERIRRSSKQPRPTRLLPVISVLNELREVGATWKWNDIPAPVLDVQVLLIPDFQIDVGSGFNFESSETSLLTQLLRYRRGRHLATFVGIQNPHKLTEGLRKELLGYRPAFDLEEVKYHLADIPRTTHPKTDLRKVPADSVRLAGLKKLVSHDSD